MSFNTVEASVEQIGIGGSSISNVNQLPTSVTEIECSVVITRPPNVTPYTANDLINIDSATALPALNFTAAYANRKIQINSINILSNYGAAATKLIPEVILYNIPNLGAQSILDHAAFNPPEEVHRAAKATAMSKSENWNLGDFAYGNFYEMRLTEIIRNATLDANGKLYVALIATNAYTPASGEILTVMVKAYLLN